MLSFITMTTHDLGWMRLSPHLYNTEDEMDRVVALIQAQR